MRDIASLLLPRPQRLYATGKEVVVKGTVRLVPTASDAAAVRAATRLEGALRGAGFDACLEYGGSKNRRTKGLTVTLAIDSDCFGRRESYRLRVGPSDAALLASDEAGLFHGSSTLTQIFALSAAARDADAHGEPAHGTAARGETIALPGLVIRDWPDFPVRGVMLDVSRDKVPTQATLLALVDMLAGWKINQLQLYFEHAFAYRNHEAVWQNASPFTGPEIRELDAYCKERHIELVPNQNSLGHMERWLAHEPYRQWAECPDGIELPFSPTRIARCLCPTDPRSLAFLTDLYDQLLPHFSSRQLNVGLDEAWEVGLGRSEGACRKSSAERVYLDYLRDVHRLLAERGQTMQFWADIIVHRPELVGELPDDVIALEWGYEADHPFAEHLQRFAREGLSFYVCPGTSSWNSIAGRTANAIANLASAARAGREAGAIGYLVTDWGDNGHLQPLPVSYLGFLVGAAMSWNASLADDPSSLDVAALLDAHAFADSGAAMGTLARDLGNAYREAGVLVPNGSSLFWLLLRADDPMPSDMSADHLRGVLELVDRATGHAPRADMARSDADLVLLEFGWAADLLRFACRLGLERWAAGPDLPVAALPAASKRKLAADLRGLIACHRQVWLRRNRPGGLDESAARLEGLLAQLSA